MRRPCLMLLMGLGLCCGSLHAAPARDARQDIQAAYAAVEAAVAHRDVSGATAYCAPGYVSEDVYGELSGVAQTRQRDARLFARARSVAITFTLIAFTRDGPDRATVTERFRTFVVLPTTAGPGKPRTSSLSGTVRDTWVKRGGRWRVLLDQSLTQTPLNDGRPRTSE